MAKEYIEKEAFISRYRELYCKDCERRKGMKNGKMRFVYEIGDAPCRACGVDDMLNAVDDWPAADVRENVMRTNADRIRAMSDEELAEYLVRDVEAEAIRRAGRYLSNVEIDRAVADALDWLKQEVDDGDPDT